jgi:hypothetical protein
MVSLNQCHSIFFADSQHFLSFILQVKHDAHTMQALMSELSLHLVGFLNKVNIMQVQKLSYVLEMELKELLSFTSYRIVI